MTQHMTGQQRPSVTWEAIQVAGRSFVEAGSGRRVLKRPSQPRRRAEPGPTDG